MAAKAKVVTLEVAGLEAVLCLFEANGTKQFSVVAPTDAEAQTAVLEAINAFIDMPEETYKALVGLRKDFRVTAAE